MKKKEDRLVYRATTYLTDAEMDKFGKLCCKKELSQAKAVREAVLTWMENA